MWSKALLIDMIVCYSYVIREVTIFPVTCLLLQPELVRSSENLTGVWNRKVHISSLDLCLCFVSFLPDFCPRKLE